MQKQAIPKEPVASYKEVRIGKTLYRVTWSDTLKPHTQGDIIKHRKGAADGTKIHGRI